MIWALQDNEKVKAIPKDTATCPICNPEVIAKCGSIKVWHWSHKSNKDCDDWYEPESEWHKKWKEEFPKECQEFTMGKHRADIRTKSRWIIELQNSSISPEEIQEREEYYKRMIWLLNGENLCRGLELRNKKGVLTFRWKHPPKSFWFANKDIYIDLNIIPISGILKKNVELFSEEQREFWKDLIGKVFYIKKIYNNIPCGGWGELITKKEFLRRFK